MGATTTYGWPYPELADPAHAPAAFQAALAGVENTVKSTAVTDYTPAWTSNGAVQPGGSITKAGKYRVDHGICTIWISMLGGAGVSGGSGQLFVGLPIAPRAGLSFQIMPAWLWCPEPGGGVYHGIARPYAGQVAMPIYLPASNSDSRIDTWRNQTDGGGPGTGIPLVSGSYPFVTNSELWVQGSYFV